MSEPITKQELIDASADALTLEQVVNGSDTTDVTSRLARTYPTMSKALRLIVEAGLLGATPFTTKTALDASALADGAYAVVTNDRDGGGVPTAQNGFWRKASGTWEFLAWNPLAQAVALVNAEQTARINADNALQTALNAEQTARANADNTLQSNINAEASTRASADSTNASAIAAEASTRASQIATLNADFAAAIGDEEDARIAADDALADLIDSEESARIAADNAEAATRASADSANAAAIDAEESARIAGDAAINAELDAETASRISADNSLQSQITAEASTRAAADATNAAAIATESSTRASADTTLQANITAEANARANADSAEQAARIAADNVLQANISTEATTRSNADSVLTAAINTEQAARIAADNTLQANINAEATTRASADTANANAISAEAATRAAAIAALSADDLELQAGIDANAAAIAAEEAARVTAVSAEQATRTEQVGLINGMLNTIFGSVRFNGYRDDAGNKYLFALVDGARVGFGITSKLKVLWGGNQLALDRMIGIKDSAGRYALAITKKGKVYAPNLVLPAWVTDTLTNLANQIAAEVTARAAGDATLTTAQNATASNLATLAANFALSVNLMDDNGNKYILALINRSNNRIIWGVTRKGEVVVTGAKHRGDRLPFVVMGKGGMAAIAVTRNGKVRIPNLVLPSSLADTLTTLTTGVSGANANRLAADIQMLAVLWYDINHLLWNGQSLSSGTESVPVISTAQPYSNVMITSGVRLALTDSGYDGTGFVPLVETLSSSGTLGESPVSGTLNGFIARFVAAGGTASNRVMLGTASGIGSRRVDQLIDEANFYKVRDHVSEAKRIATAAGKSYGVTAICWAQGESDIGSGVSGNTSFADYYRRYLQLMTNMRQVIVDVSGQPFMPYVFSYQTSGHQSYGKQILHVPMAQWRASRELHDVVMATPSYRLPCAGDNLHLTNEGSWLLGQYVARAMFWTFELGQKWRPLEPIDVLWSSTQIDIKYHVPCKPIQISTAICTAVTNSGFDIWTASNTLISNAISSVAVLNDDTVRITLNPAATIPADAVLSYGRARAGDPATTGVLNNPPCGNVLDSHGLYESVTAPTTGTVYPLTNVGVLFQFRRNLGFH